MPEELYITYREMLVGIAKAILGRDDDTAEDVVQDVFLWLCQKKPKNIQNPEQYLIKAVTHKAINEREKVLRQDELLRKAM
jgi:DNA-directed RNA polymerase specialized sigma24 family protein